MELNSDITTEDLEVFLIETEEQLQTLDEAIVQLEQEGSDPDLMSEIFRAAHTIKGSSAMVGHHQITQLSHSMESLLDLVRLGTLEFGTHVADALLHSLDLLRQMKDELAGAQDGRWESTVDISQAVAELEDAAGEDGTPPGDGNSADTEAVMELDSAAAGRLQGALDAGQRVHQINVSIRRDTTWPVVRAFQVLSELSKDGEVITSNPTAEEIEAEAVGFHIQVLLASRHSEEDLRGILDDVEDLASVDVFPYEPGALRGYSAEPAIELDPRSSTANEPRKKVAQQPQTLRVDVERLDYLMNTIGELVIDRTRIQQISRYLESKYREDPMVQSLGETSAHVVKVVDELQEEIMKVRMLPVGTVFNGLPRMVRDVAQKFGKKVDFTIDGQDTEVDRTIVERLRDPLMHLLRNSVDHGIEAPEARLAAGKPEVGSIRLSAYHDQGHLVITVEDDGRGIDPNVMRNAAVKKGLISPDAVSKISDKEAIDIIFMPGASTADKTTDISGRGVGMDVVKTNIEAINGFVTADTEVGKGTKFTLSLPLTLATLQALLVSMGQTIFAVPVIHVLESVRVEPGDIKTIEGREVIRLRERVVPLLRLRTILNRNDPEASESPSPYVVVVRIKDRLVGLAVDGLMELQEIMVKSLGKHLQDVKGIAGASILGDGRIVLILDVPALVYTSTMKGQPEMLTANSEVLTANAGVESGGPDEEDPTLIPGSLADSLALAA